jgi:hypothetical protein
MPRPGTEASPFRQARSAIPRRAFHFRPDGAYRGGARPRRRGHQGASRRAAGNVVPIIRGNPPERRDDAATDYHALNMHVEIRHHRRCRPRSEGGWHSPAAVVTLAGINPPCRRPASKALPLAGGSPPGGGLAGINPLR